MRIINMINMAKPQLLIYIARMLFLNINNKQIFEIRFNYHKYKYGSHYFIKSFGYVYYNTKCLLLMCKDTEILFLKFIHNM
jgi:hypothetical protein